MRDHSRRQFIMTAAGAAGAVALGGADALLAQRGRRGLPPPQQSGIDRIVVVMMENRSFDHMLGWLPGATGQQAGRAYLDRDGIPHNTYPLYPDFQGCGHPDPDHSYEGGRVEYNDGGCDGWLRAGDNDLYAIGYYTQGDLQFYGPASPDWTVCDRFFSPIMGPTFPNRLFLHCGQTDRLTNSLAFSSLPTIWDRLAQRDVRARYYFSDVPFLALWRDKYVSISRPIDDFFEACATGRLPPVSFVEPRFLGASLGVSTDDHPHADIRNGQLFQHSIYAAVTSSPEWHHTLLVFVYDEWGGFFEHVPPTIAAVPAAPLTGDGTDGLRGFRVPCMLVSPFAPRATVSHVTFDHTSILRFIEWRWRLDPLTARDATATNLADALDFGVRNLYAPTYAVDPRPHLELCPQVGEDKWSLLRAAADLLGF
jgi:phospholipase C